MAIRRICEFLDGSHVPYLLISHPPADTAQEVAESMHLPGHCIAKAVVVKLDKKLAMAVVPATREVDLGRLSKETGSKVQLAAEVDFAERFVGCQLGAAPPFGNLFGLETYVDRDLTREEFIAFNAGTHTDAISMRSCDYLRLANPRVVWIASDPVVARSHFAQI